MTSNDNSELPEATLETAALDQPPDTGVADVRSDALDAARHYQQRSRSASTWRTYASAWRHFIDWCESADFQALPATGECVAQFLATEARRGLAPTTLAHRLAAIRLAHVGAGHPSPHETLAVTEVMRGIRSDWGRPPAKKTAAVDDDLRLMADTIDTTALVGLRDRALLLYGFAGAFRRSELVGLDVADIEAHPCGQLVTIRRSKTDQAAQGQIVAVLAQPGSPWCPVAALAAWQDVAGITTGALFRRLYRGGRVGEQRLAAAHVATVVKAACRPLGLDPARYAGHSLRRGFLTSAGQTGADLVALVAQSRHTRVDSVLQYLDPRERFERHAGQALLREPDPTR